MNGRKINLVRSICVLLMLGIPGWALMKGQSSSRIRVLETGQFHGDEVKARTDEQWLGLYITKNASALILSKLTVKQVHDEVVDEEDDQKTGKQVSVNRTTEPIFLVKGATMLHPGPVVTVHNTRKVRETALSE